MNVFPTRILLASDGSESAAHATEVAVELSKKTHSELHVLYVGEDSTASLYPQAADPAWVVQEDLSPLEEQGQQFEQVARRTLDAEVQQVRAVGGTVAQAHLRACLVSNKVGLGGAKSASPTPRTAPCEPYSQVNFLG
jgi:nucleotide-binding universal stress UspA family protein